MPDSPYKWIPENEEFAPPAGMTILYNVAPANCPQFGREGMLSYLIRLSRDHSLSPRTLVRDICGMMDLRIRNICKNRFYRKDALSVSGVGMYADLFSDTLSKLTGRHDLRKLTMLDWTDLLPENGEAMNARTPRWCPFCLAEQASLLGYNYYPLAWSLALYEKCPRHGQTLRSACRKCSCTQPFIPQYPDLSHCVSCGASLLEPDDHQARQALASPIYSPEHSLEEMIFSDAKPSLELFRANLKQLIKIHADGNKAAFCSSLGWDKWAANAWLNKGQKPTLMRLVSLSTFYRVPISSLCSMHLTDADISARIEFMPPQKSRQTPPRLSQHQVESVGQYLMEILQRNPPVSLNNVGKELGLSRSTLKYWHPDLTHAVSKKFHGYVAGKKVEADKHRIERVRQVLDAITEEGRLPCRREIDLRLKPYGLALARPELSAYYKTRHSPS